MGVGLQRSSTHKVRAHKVAAGIVGAHPVGESFGARHT